MGQLSERFAQLCREYGTDPTARAADVHALAALEGRDVKEAHARFVALRRDLAVTRRAELLHALRGFAFVRDVPPDEVRGMGQREIDREIRWATAALRRARAIRDALAEAALHRASLRERALPEDVPLEAAPWDALSPLEAEAESRRRAAAREARLESRIVQARRRAERHGVAMPALGEDPDVDLDALEARLDAAERLAAARDAAMAPLRAPEVGAWRGESKRALAKEIEAARDVDALRALQPRAEALRAEAAKAASEAARARRSGRTPPTRERRPGDALDGYG
ncbi:MAG: hypothetical protein QOE90_446 [Thermoplasmata archaeon]|nr:hypothetical protein [Thermoplasmata archaeon]